MIHKVLKQKWVAALRSGEFKQSQFRLFNTHDRGYCCLGVLAVQLGATLDKEGNLRVNNNHMGCNGLEYLREECAGGLNREIQQQLSEMNDATESRKHRYNFNQIANWIEVNL